MNLITSIFVDLFYNFKNFLARNLVTFSRILKVAMPIVIFYLGTIYDKGNSDILCYAVIVLLSFWFVEYFLESLANKIGKGITVPVPHKRFTNEDEYGEVTIPNERLEELILYVNDLENWLEKKRLLKK